VAAGGEIERGTFGNCAACQLVQVASVQTCYECAREVVTAPPAGRCVVCSQRVPAGGACPNGLCHSADRQFGTVTTLGMLSGELQSKIHRHKYAGKWGWAVIFGRLLAGHVRANYQLGSIGLIVAAPTFTGNGAYPHTEQVLHWAAEADPFTFPWDEANDPAIVQTGPTDKVAGAGIAARRRKAAQLREVLAVAHPERVDGRRVLIFDDVFTSGHSVNEVARALRAAGATSVDCVILARTPW
jgi:predicted amidophosphoribosyltransferase